MKTFSFMALGCKVNQYEVRTIAAQLMAYGLQATPFNEQADLCIINTCCVTSESEAKSRKIISRARRTSPNAVIVITGCYAQIAQTLPDAVDLCVPNTDKERCAQIIVEYLSQRGIFLEKQTDVHIQPLLHDRTRATIKVQDGCDNFCSYCIIPYARGKLTSKPVAEAVDEISRMAKCAFREVVLTGIHLTKYGVDFDDNIELVDLIEKINEIDGIDRIRLGSLEPGYLTDERVQRLAKCEKLCGHFHLSLQSGCEATLLRMNRKYTPKQYADEIALLRNAFPDCAITTDVITGFPEESEEEFEESMAFVKACDFSKVHVFTYSVRPGTVAAQMKQIPETVRRERCHQMIEATEKSRTDFLDRSVGKIYPVLCEGKRGGWIHGFTDNYIPVVIPASQAQPNELILVKIDSKYEDYCKGERI